MGDNYGPVCAGLGVVTKTRKREQLTLPKANTGALCTVPLTQMAVALTTSKSHTPSSKCL